MAETLAAQLAVEQTGPGEFISQSLPAWMGNSLPIAYGGCTLGIATRAAIVTVPSSHSLYSLVGHYLGPASIKQKLLCTVHTMRNTKNFATRRVEVKQHQPDGKLRVCLELLADFHVQEPELMSYSALPSHPYSGPDSNPTIPALATSLANEGKLDKRQAALAVAPDGMFKMTTKYFDMRPCVEGPAGQTLFGLARGIPTTQDELSVTEKASAEWVKTWDKVDGVGERMATLSFLMDGALAFLPLAHSSMWFDDTEANSSLDFALRIFVPNIDLGDWHLRERKTHAAGFGRQYSEGRLWDEKGTLVACMTQQCILRPKMAPKTKTKAEL
ncbi:thioesterase-like superfamily-domain-containing protein [Pseudomassariella vexata]|uniref:Thioesterase-like superfamily-domain-containing protein n=1 Tax=Pseudomassariella vexata TaxID=1141098 RepID=A0A1Y2E8B1_9PEZI|nr:thioesterase-like superfamily-domain-containing protein [Pseudomassariella vexata]ORY67516.1 thioesterase-like superfamily-domain-containing protein [Pseudomassariella vexata]